MINENLEQRAARLNWEQAWHAVVDLKKRFAPEPVPAELRGDLEAKVEAAAFKYHSLRGVE